MDIQQKSAVLHPLAEKDLTHIRNWGEWRKLWEKETYAEMLHSLLHFGFTVPVASPEEEVDRLCLYLEIADNGKEGLGNFSRQEDCWEFPPCETFGHRVYSNAGICGALREKALQALCQNFFKNTAAPSDSLYSWAKLATYQQTLAKLFWFFRLDSSGNILNIRFLKEGRQSEIIDDFIRKFCLFVWDLGNRYLYFGNLGVTEDVRTALRSARTDIVALLVGFGEFDLLLRGNRYEGLDEECLEKLKELALAYKLHLPGNSGGNYRNPSTIEEACLGNSQAARTLILLRTLFAEKERFDRIQELDEQRREAEEEIEKLKKGK